MAYDDLLKEINKKFFLRRLFGIFFFNGFPNAIAVTIMAFLFYLPNKYRCSLPQDVEELIRKNQSLLNETLSYFIPYDDDKNEYSSCLMYNRTYVDVAYFMQNQTTVRIEENLMLNTSQEVTVSCGSNYHYSSEQDLISASMEFNLICDRAWIKPFVLSFIFFGKVGSGVSGILSDKFGRRPVFICSTLIVFSLLFLLSFMESMWSFGVVGVAIEIFSVVNFLVGFVIAAEYTTPENRNFVSIASFLSYSFGYGLLSLIGYLTPNWRWMVRVGGLFGLLYIANIWLIDESPRWLMSVGRVKEAKEVFKKIAKINKQNLSSDFLERIEEESKDLVKEKEESHAIERKPRLWKTLIDMLRNPRLFLIILVLLCSWFSINLIYFGMLINVHALAGNIYLNNTLMGLVEIPGLILVYLGVKYLSRPVCHGGSVILCAIFCLAAALLQEELPYVSGATALIGKSLISGSFYLVYFHTAETFPTVVRGSYTTLLSGVGRFASIFSPYLVYLGEIYGQNIPYFIMSLVTASSGLATLLFTPQTNSKELPETTEDVLNMKRIASQCCQKMKKHKSQSKSNQTMI